MKGDSIVAKVTKEKISAKVFAIQIYTEDFKNDCIKIMMIPDLLFKIGCEIEIH